jgi:type VI secretion system ImpJ/VasE family protein
MSEPDQLRRVHWSQGVFLTPQHFQQQDMLTQSLIRQVWRQFGPNAWGVRRLVLSERGLQAGLVEVEHCEMVMESGVYLRGGAAEPAPNAIFGVCPRVQATEADRRDVRIYAVVRRHNAEGRNVSGTNGAAGGRYETWKETIRDAYDPEGLDEEVDFLKYQVDLIADTDPNFKGAESAFEMIRLVELRVADRRVAPIAYVPPCLTIGASPPLLKSLRDLRGVLNIHSQDFAEFKRARGVGSTSSSGIDAERALVLVILNRAICGLVDALERPWLHPEEVYAFLRGLVGELSAFTRDYDADGSHEVEKIGPLPPYDHRDIARCFQEVDMRLRGIAGALSVGSEDYVELRLEPGLEGRFSASLSPEYVESRSSRYYLVIDADRLAAEDESRWKYRLCAGKAMDELSTRAAAGVAITKAYPPEVPNRARRACYQIDTQSQHWQRVLQDRDICLWMSDLPKNNDTRVRLLKLPAGEKFS